MADTDSRLIVLAPEDNVCIACCDIEAGTELTIDGTAVTLPKTVPLGHKLARLDLQTGDKVLKYGGPIGSTRRAIAKGEHVHTQNLKSDYIPTFDREGNEDVGQETKA